MRFDYNTMREYASKKEPIGKYNGVLVFPISKKDYQNLQDDRGYYYLIYDDCNIIVKYNYVYAWLSDNGDLHEFEKKIYLTNKDEKPAVVRNDNEEVQKDNVIVDNNIKDESSEIEDNLYSAFFDRISQEIDNILKGDFNYEVGTN